MCVALWDSIIAHTQYTETYTRIEQLSLLCRQSRSWRLQKQQYNTSIALIVSAVISDRSAAESFATLSEAKRWGEREKEL